MRRLLSFLALAAFAAGPLACSSSDSTNSADPSTGDEQDVKGAKILSEGDHDKTVPVAVGQSFYIQLASNPTTGFHWSVKSVDKTLGAPKEKFISGGSSATGSGGEQRFTWSTKSPLDLNGKHVIELEYQRPFAENAPPAKTFKVTIQIGASANCEALSSSDCVSNSACVFIPGHACDPIPGGPPCPAGNLPHCATK